MKMGVPKPQRVLVFKLEARLKAGIKFDKQVRAFIAHAPALDIYSQGLTKAEAKRALTDATQSYLLVAYRKGILEKVLHSAGFSLATGKGEFKHMTETGYINFTEEEVLEEREYADLFDFPAWLQLESRMQDTDAVPA